MALGGNSWDRAGKVWYDALTSGAVGSEADFATFAQATIDSAGRLFPDDPQPRQAVADAWAEVGLLSDTSPATGSTPESVPASSPEPSPEPSPESSPESSPAPESAPPAEGETVAVRRTGGFAGGVRSNTLDLRADPEGAEVRRLLNRVDLSALPGAQEPERPVPDRFVYTVEYGEVRVTVAETQLGPELSRVVQIVLGQHRHTL